MSVYELPIESLRAAAVHVADEKEKRHWMRGVYLKLDPHTSVAFGCNGTTGAAVSLPGQVDLHHPIEMILPPHAIPMTGAIAWLKLRVLDQIKPGVFKIEVSSAKNAPFTLETIDAHYLDWRRLFAYAEKQQPQLDETGLVPFSPDKLALFSKSAKMLGYKNDPGAHVKIQRRDTTALITIASRSDFIGICECLKMKDLDRISVPHWAMA